MFILYVIAVYCANFLTTKYHFPFPKIPLLLEKLLQSFFSPSRDSMMPYDIIAQKFPNPLKQEVTTHENEMNHSLPAL